MHPLLFAAALAVAPTPSGRVVDRTGAPLPQARVTVLEINRSATSDLEGRHLLPGMPTGAYGISSSPIGSAPVVRRAVVSGDLTGTVRDSTSGQPLAGAEVIVSRDNRIVVRS